MKNVQKLRGIWGIFAIAGMGAFVALVISLVTFAGEHVGWTPIWALFNVPWLSTGDNVCAFVISFIAACFVAVWIVAVVLKLWKW